MFAQILLDSAHFHEPLYVDSKLETARKYCQWAAKYNHRYVKEEFDRDLERRCTRGALKCIGASTAVGAGTGGGIGAMLGFSGGPILSATAGGLGVIFGGVAGLLSGMNLAMAAVATIKVNSDALRKRIQEEEKSEKNAAERFDKFLKSMDLGEKYECPYGLKIIEYPVRGPDNVVYERACIEAWIAKKNKDGKGVASAYGEIDFEVEDLVFDYRTALEMKKDLAKVMRAQLEVSQEGNRFFRQALQAKIKDLELEIETYLEEWMKGLNEVRETKKDSISSLVEKYARLAHEFGVEPKRMYRKIELILDSEWGEIEKDYFDSCYRTKTPAYLYEIKNEYKFNT